MFGEWLEENCPDVSVKTVIKHQDDWNAFLDSVSVDRYYWLCHRSADHTVSTREAVQSFIHWREPLLVMELSLLSMLRRHTLRNWQRINSKLVHVHKKTSLRSKKKCARRKAWLLKNKSTNSYRKWRNTKSSSISTIASFQRLKKMAVYSN